MRLFEVIQLQIDLSEAIKDYISAFFRGAASRPAGLPRYGGGALNAGLAWIGGYQEVDVRQVLRIESVDFGR